MLTLVILKQYIHGSKKNPIYLIMADIPNCPTPIIIEDESGTDEVSKNGNLENQVEIQ
jgi:hypothetical protein